MSEIPVKYIKKLGMYMSDDLKYAALIDAETKKPVVFFPGRAFLLDALNLLEILEEEFGRESILKFLREGKLQKC